MTRGELASLRRMVSKMARGARFSKLRHGSWEITDASDILLARIDDSDEADLFEKLNDDVLDELLELAEQAIDAEEEIRAAGFTSLGDLIEAQLEAQRSAVDRLADLADA